MRRSPQATPREFARYIAAVAEAGLREEEAVAETEPRAVQVMTMHSAKGLEFEHVYVLGLQSARMPGARRRAAVAVPDALLHETLPPDSRDAHVAEMRRLLGLAITRARQRVVLALWLRDPGGVVQRAGGDVSRHAEGVSGLPTERAAQPLSLRWPRGRG